MGTLSSLYNLDRAANALNIFERNRFNPQCAQLVANLICRDQTLPRYRKSNGENHLLRHTRDGRRYRALNPWGPQDGRLLQLINQGEFAINGFRNRDIRTEYFKSR